MQNYTIMPLDVEHLEEICQDIKEQYDHKIERFPDGSHYSK